MDDPDRMVGKDYGVERWTYNNHLREYLLLVARKGRMAFESGEKFPKRMELSEDWHTMLDEVRRATRDGKERWALVGVKQERTALFLPTIPAVGYDNYVPSEVMEKEGNRARENFGIVDLVGDVHSHPTDFGEKALQRLPAFNSLGLKAQFSAGDYYGICVPGRARAFMGVVEGDYNLFAFSTRQTQNLPVDPAMINQESFEKYWYEKFGFKYLGGVQKYGAFRAVPVAGGADSVAMNAAIAKRHGLVLYQGAKGKDLTKVFPSGR